jgi:hypothetical protein
MSLKVYIHLQISGYAEKTSKIPLPKSWVETKQVHDVIALFLKSYNEKNSENAVNIEEVHLASKEGSKIYSTDVVGTVLEDHGDYYIKLGKHVKESVDLASVDSGKLRCKNYGCNKYFSEHENTEDCCVHHTGPPIFHDTMKCWSCCKDRKAYDFEAFQQISGCARGLHSHVSKSIVIAPSPNASTAGASDAGVVVFETPALRSISDYNDANPAAVSAAASAVKQLATRKSSRKEDGTARCQRQGCGKIFNFSDRVEGACLYHKGSAVFHDAAKFWSCCPDKKFFEFDDFLKYPGCCSGYHDDGVCEL